ncbi:class I SAM-dependent methyltransferase [Actinoplanes sp. NPDC049599]|uniref:class I SAM-dependent methyltransferase n=1 Tax=Actinoplanes sp. NPDC049599 TaxID=3363903 RepID=UPI0037941C42
MHSEMPGVIGVFDEASASYDSVGVDFFTPMGAELVHRAAIRAGEHVLDIGCGRGAVLLPAAAAAGPTGRVVGIDLAPGMVARTAAATAHLPAVSVRVGDAQAPAFPPGAFDVLTAGLVLFFLPDPPAALAAYRELLRPGGRLAFSSFVAFDPRYERAMKTIAGFTEGLGPRREHHEMFKSQEGIRAALSGWPAPRITEFTLVSGFTDAAQWMRWVGSHGGLEVVRAIPAARRDEAVEAAAGALADAADDTGVIRLTTTIRVVVADR